MAKLPLVNSGSSYWNAGEPNNQTGGSSPTTEYCASLLNNVRSDKSCVANWGAICEYGN
jgi:hypothetical protein